MAKKRDRAIVKGGLWFILKTGPRRVMVINPETPKSNKTFKVSTDVINHYDLRIWASGWLSASQDEGLR